MTETLTQILVAVIVSVLGVGGLSGLFLKKIQRQVDDRLKSAEQEAEKQREFRRIHEQQQQKIQSLNGRLFSWIIEGGNEERAETEKRKALEELKQAEQQYRDMKDNAFIDILLKRG